MEMADFSAEESGEPNLTNMTSMVSMITANTRTILMSSHCWVKAKLVVLASWNFSVLL